MKPPATLEAGGVTRVQTCADLDLADRIVLSESDTRRNQEAGAGQEHVTTVHDVSSSSIVDAPQARWRLMAP